MAEEQPVREIADAPIPNIARTALNDKLKSRSCMKENLEELSAEKCLRKATGKKRILFSRTWQSERSPARQLSVKAQMRWKRPSGAKASLTLLSAPVLSQPIRSKKNGEDTSCPHRFSGYCIIQTPNFALHIRLCNTRGLRKAARQLPAILFRQSPHAIGSGGSTGQSFCAL
jgi:hypothetical protein